MIRWSSLFNDVAGTEISLHTPDTGSALVKWPAGISDGFNGDAFISDANRLRASGAGFTHYIIPDTPTTDRWTMRGNFRILSLTGFAALWVRASEDVRTGYHISFPGDSVGSGGVQLYRGVAGALTELGTRYPYVDGSVGSDHSFSVETWNDGATVRILVTVDGATAFDFTDSNAARVTQIGQGVWQPQSPDNTTSVHLSDGELEDQDAGVLAGQALITIPVTSDGV